MGASAEGDHCKAAICRLMTYDMVGYNRDINWTEVSIILHRRHHPMKVMHRIDPEEQ